MSSYRSPPSRRARAQRRVNLLVGLIAASCIFAAPAAYWGVVNFVPPFRAPARAQPQPNGYAYARSALARRELRLPPSARPFSELSIQEQARLTVIARPALDEVRGAFSLPWLGPSPTPEVQSDRGYFEQCGKCFAMESRVAASRGRWADALGSAVDAMELGGNVCRGGAVRERFLAQVCQFEGLAQAQRLYSRLPLPALRAELPRIRRIRQTWPTIGETIENERILALEACTRRLEQLRTLTPLEQLALAGERLGAPQPEGLLSWLPPSFLSPAAWSHVLTPRTVALAQLDRFYRELTIASSMPAPNGVPLVQVASVWSEPFATASFVGRYRGEWARNNLTLLEAALAARAAYLERGAHPESLGELPTHLLPEVPVDVWGQPLRLRIVGEGALIYSIGPDGKDDGGRAVEPSRLIRGGSGDLVFGKLCSDDWPRPKLR